MNKKLERFYRAEELAKALDLNVITIYRYIKSGKLPAYKFGKEFRIDHETFKKFLENAKTNK